MSKYRKLFRAWRLDTLSHHVKAYGGNRSRAARDLGIDRTWLCRVLRESKRESA